MPANEIHQNDIGTLFKCTIKDGTTVVNVSGVTIKQLLFNKPNGSTLTKSASFFTNGVDGIITYTSVSGDLDTVGNWKLQGRVQFNSASDFKSDIAKFRVYPNI